MFGPTVTVVDDNLWRRNAADPSDEGDDRLTTMGLPRTR